ncbi:MAG: molybdopterin-synthase adenylyltransferase MoeB [Sulfobacillus sp.]
MAQVSVYVPTPYRKHTAGQSTVPADGATVGEALADLCQRQPGLGNELFDAQGQLAAYLNVYVDDTEIRSLSGLDTVLAGGEELALIPAMAGGSQSPRLLSPVQVERYSRQIILPELGMPGQRKLLAARVLVVGAGGLGAPVIMYLASAGVGTIGIVDGDLVDRSNLHRQPLHREQDVGGSKVASAQRFVTALNPDVSVITHPVVLERDNALELIGGYDLVVNGSDNFPTRYLVNDACVLLNKPLIDASILRFEGQATVFMPGKGCYRCLFPTPPEPGTVPSCAEAGVMGALAGQMGSIQALEAIKVLLGVGETLANRLLVVDALAGVSRTFRWQRRPDCALCGDHPSQTGLIDYVAFCGSVMPRRGVDAPGAEELSLQDAQERLGSPGVLWVDVRPRAVFAAGSIPGAVSMPIDELSGHLEDLRRADQVVFFCEIGQKSQVAALVAVDSGISAANLRGGLLAWQDAHLPWQDKA